LQEQIKISIENLLKKLIEWFDSLIVNLPNILLASLVFFLSYYLANKISRKTTSLLSKRIKQGSIRNLIGSVISILIMVFGIVLALGILNLDQALNSLIAGAGVAGLAIGLAVQGTLSNTFAGISLSIKDDINIGDFIESNGFAGTVVDINLRDTKIRTIDNNLVIIPNNSISGNPYKNYSLTQDLRVAIESGVGYDSDLNEVESITKKTISDRFTHRKDEIAFYYLSFGDSAINFQLRFWIQATKRNTLVKARSEAIVLIKEAFDKENINIPYPITTIISDQ
jgi:small conductance mechanosensitive channel